MTRGLRTVKILLVLSVLFCAGPSKAVVLIDDEGTEEKVEFESKRDFELWATTNTLKLSSKDGHKKYIKTWERLQDGGRYYTSMTLGKRVSGLDLYGMVVHCR